MVTLKHDLETNTLNQLKEKCVIKLKTFLTHLIETKTDNDRYSKRASLIGKWISKYVDYLQEDDTFSPGNLIRYKRGSVILVDYGYRVGRELGGVHYAIVLDVRNSKNSPIITTIPLSSVKENGKEDSVFKLVLQKGIFELAFEKIEKKMLSETSDDGGNKSLEEFEKDEYINRYIEQIKKMKMGSEVLLSQIAAVSKQRIISPKSKNDLLFGIQIEQDDMRSLDEKLKQLIFGNY